MENFGVLLKKFIEEINISVSQFAKTLQFNRGWLYSVFDGTKSLPEEKFQIILAMSCFTQYQKTALREAYYREIYGSAAINRVLYLQSAFRGKSGLVAHAKIYNYTPSKNIESVAGINQLCSVVDYLLRNELEFSDSHHVYTNFPYSFTEMDDTVYEVMSSSGGKLPLDHIIVFEPGRTDTYNINNIFASLRYIQLRSNPQCLYETGSIDISGNRLYPCFFVTSSCLFLFDPVTFTGLVIADKTAAVSARFYTQRIVSRCKPLAIFSRDEIDLKQIIAKTNHQNIEISFGNQLCIGVFADEEIADGLLRPDLPAREATIQIALNYYGQYLKANENNSNVVTSFHSQRSFEEFAKTGIVSEVSNRIVVPASVETRKKILIKMLAGVENGTICTKLVDSTLVDLPDRISIEISKNNACVFGMISDGTDGYFGEYFINITDSMAIADFRNYADYILRNGFTLPDEYFKHFLRDLILHCSDEDMKR